MAKVQSMKLMATPTKVNSHKITSMGQDNTTMLWIIRRLNLFSIRGRKLVARKCPKQLFLNPKIRISCPLFLTISNSLKSAQMGLSA